MVYWGCKVLGMNSHLDYTSYRGSRFQAKTLDLLAAYNLKPGLLELQTILLG
jgi:hypothetical protein